MPIYLYKCPTHNEFEIEHSMHDVLEFCPKCQEEGNKNPKKVTRLIAGGTHFTLVGSGWASDNYK